MRRESPGTQPSAAMTSRHAPGEERATGSGTTPPTDHPATDPIHAASPSLAAATEAYRILRSVGGDHGTRYRTLLNAVPDAVTLHDERGRIIDANAAPSPSTDTLQSSCGTWTSTTSTPTCRATTCAK